GIAAGFATVGFARIARETAEKAVGNMVEAARKLHEARIVVGDALGHVIDVLGDRTSRLRCASGICQRCSLHDEVSIKGLTEDLTLSDFGVSVKRLRSRLTHFTGFLLPRC